MNRSITDFLSPEQIASIRQPIESALTLPSRAFIDEEFYQLEVEKIYKRHWVAAFFAVEVAEAGDIKPFELCEIPLLAVRGQDNKVRVFHNICPYDGSMAAIDPAQNCQEIVTPYHGWIYDLEGKLTKTPYWDGTRESNLDVLAGKQVDLATVNSEIFLNTVFINLSDTPENFQDYIAPILRSTKEYDLNRGAVGLDENGNTLISNGRVKTNWKTYYENACLNVLHENFVHKLYNASPEVPRIKEDGNASFSSIIDDKFMALGYNRLDFQLTYPHMEVPHLGENPEVEPVNETFGTLYPNFYFSASSQFVELSLLLPKSPSEVEAKAIYYFQKDVAVMEEVAEVRKMIATGLSAAFEEDGRICEALQKAKKSPVYQQKFYAPFWDKMHHRLSNMIIDDLEKP